MTTENITKIVELTDAARAEVRRLIQEDSRATAGLRLGVKGGGCSGLSYVIDLDEPRETDLRQPEDGFDILMDRKSSLYLKDITLDFHGGLQDRGFKFVNPNATNTCGCGASFSV